MSNPFVAEIRIFTGNFAPTGWAQCNGQILPISQNTALFSLLGTTYGGDGKSNFALPNLQGAAPMQQGQGPGLSLRDLGETGGDKRHVVTTEMPRHGHILSATTTTGTTAVSTNNQLALASAGGGKQSAGSVVNYYSTNNPTTQLSPTEWCCRGSQPHNNMMPYLGLTFIIALQGVFPARS